MNKLRSSRLLERISPLVLADLRRMHAAAETERGRFAHGERGRNLENRESCVHLVEWARYDPERGAFVIESRILVPRAK